MANFREFDGQQFVELALQGSSSDAHYRHVQSAPSTSWLIVHNLGKIPAISVFDTSGRRIYGSEDHIDLNSTLYTFSTPVSGEATAN